MLSLSMGVIARFTTDVPSMNNANRVVANANGSLSSKRPSAPGSVESTHEPTRTKTRVSVTRASLSGTTRPRITLPTVMLVLEVAPPTAMVASAVPSPIAMNVTGEEFGTADSTLVEFVVTTAESTRREIPPESTAVAVRVTRSPSQTVAAEPERVSAAGRSVAETRREGPLRTAIKYSCRPAMIPVRGLKLARPAASVLATTEGSGAPATDSVVTIPGTARPAASVTRATTAAGSSAFAR